MLIIKGKPTTYMRYSFVYDASIADKLNGKKQAVNEQNPGVFRQSQMK